MINLKIKILNYRRYTYLQSTIEVPISVRNAKGEYNFTELLSKYVLNGSEYILWEVDEEEQQALFFQKVMTIQSILIRMRC